MARILCITTGLAGIVNATIELARRLEAAGHQVTYASPWGEAGEAASRQGIRFQRLASVSFDPAPRPGAPGRLGRIWTAWSTAGKRRCEGEAALGTDAFKATLNDLKPELALIDGELPEHILTAIAQGVSVATLSQHSSFWRRPGLPPVNTLLTPDAGGASIELAWLRLRARRAREIAQAIAATGGTDRRSVLLAYARRIGVPWSDLELTSWLPPFRFRRLPMLQMTAREFDFPHSPLENVRPAGPMVSPGREERTLAPNEEARLAGVLDEAAAKGRQLLYCSLSSKDAGDAQFVERLAQAVAPRPDWALVVALGGNIDPAGLDLQAGNVHAFSWLPQLRLLRRADCAINHGGIHSIHEALHFRVPMLVYSGGRYDQNGCAARVRYHELGLTGDKDRDSPDQIRRKLERVLESERFRQRVSAMQQQIETYREQGVLEEAVETLLTKGDAGC